MGDVADDTFNTAFNNQMQIDIAVSNGCKPCPKLNEHNANTICSICHDLNWIDKDNNPCEI